ncbi:MAG: hypothetical protein HW397_376 [Dehalococcoidia bacterium]|nr:hypothetical protein [Dehalococcoidia bacterium]
MLWLKKCPRCAGDLSEQQDMYGTEVICLQCGYYLRPSEQSQLRRTHGLATAPRWDSSNRERAILDKHVLAEPG